MAVNPLSPTPQNPSYAYTTTAGRWSTSYAPSSAMKAEELLSSQGLSLAPTRPLGTMRMGHGEVLLAFNCTEAGRELTLTYAPEPDMTAAEVSKLMLLVTMVTHDAIHNYEDALTYVRANHLERHFRFS